MSRILGVLLQVFSLGFFLSTEAVFSRDCDCSQKKKAAAQLGAMTALRFHSLFQHHFAQKSSTMLMVIRAQ